MRRGRSPPARPVGGRCSTAALPSSPPNAPVVDVVKAKFSDEMILRVRFSRLFFFPLPRTHARALVQVDNESILVVSDDTALRVAAAEEARHLESYQNDWATLEADWKRAITPIYEQIEGQIAAAAEDFPAWDPGYLESWRPREDFINSAQFGHLKWPGT